LQESGETAPAADGNHAEWRCVFHVERAEPAGSAYQLFFSG
jgi:hypothetical protein